MKTFQQFCEQAYDLREFKIGSLSKGVAKSVGADVAGEVIKKASGNNPIVSKAVDVATAGVGLGRLGGPVATGVTLGTQVLAPAALKLAQQRRQAQQARYTSLIPSGTSVSGKPAQIVPLKK